MQTDDYSFENLKNFTYVECTIKETTRYFGPGVFSFFRQAREDNDLKGVPMKKGTIINLNTVGFHYSSKYYKDPTEFRPDRWISECDDVPTFAFAGFSGGPRGCIGKHLARLEAKVAVIKFFKRYKKI